MYTTINEISLKKPLESPMRVGKQRIFDIAERLQNGTPAFALTGSVHSAVLIHTSDKREIVMDDVARHNAVDKAVGRALLEGFDFSQSILARSGRTSSEIVYKTRRCGIPVTVARGAPTHQAVHLAKEMGITVIGFARPGSFNVYSCEERIVT
jgi:FdhD protein